MNPFLYAGAFVAGLAAVAWVGAGYAGSHPLALTMTLLIGAFYLAGAAELQRHRRDTRALGAALAALAAPPAALADWLAALPAPLRGAVRRRAEGQRVALPGPSLTPYVVGLLVLLGMLGTFLGMVVTLNGTVVALEGSVELQALRSALAAPVRGLGLAFGTSVAGVCASATLGLMSTLARRERLAVAEALDSACAGPLRGFSPGHQREESLRLMQAQAQLLPALVERLDGLMTQLARQHDAAGSRLADEQARFVRETGEAWRALAASVDRSLQAAVADGTRAATERLQGLVADAMAGAAAQSAALHERAASAAQQQLDGLVRQVGTRLDGAAEAWSAALARHDAAGTELLRQLGDGQRAAQQALAQTFASQADALAQRLAAAEDERREAWRRALDTLAAGQQQAWQRAGDAALAQQQALCATLEATARDMSAQAQAHAQATIAEIARLMQTAAEAPRVAADVIGRLREQLSASVAHDNALLEERQRLLAQMAALLEGVRGQADAQREAAAAFAARLEDAAAQVAGGAAEVASLGEAFGGGVQRFGDANERLLAQLQRVEAALGQAGERSDAQLAYYVAQARELIDLSVLSQQRAVEEIRQLGRHAAPQPADEAA